MALKGVVLDFDGVIARSMELHAESYCRVLAPFGLQPQVEDIYVREGGRSETIIEDLLAQKGVRLSPARVHDLAEEKQRVFSTLGPVPLYQGADDMVRRIRAAAGRLGLVTGTRRENLSRLIPHLLPLFDAVLAQDAYTHDKPHPEPYQKAASALGLAPRDCAALENAVKGIQSAKAAGYGFVVGITTTMPDSALRDDGGADAIAATHADAAQRLVAWAARDVEPPAHA